MENFEFDWTSSDGLTLRGQGWLPAGTPRAVVALVHGFSEHAGRYAHVAAHLNQHSYALIGFDLRGHGTSAGARGHAPSYSNYQEDIREFLALITHKFAGLPVFLYGHSAGGGMVLNYALRFRPAYLQGVIATSPWLQLAFAPPAAKLWVAKLAAKIYPAFQEKAGLNPDDISSDPEVARAYATDPLNHGFITAGAFVGLVQAGEQALAQAAGFPLPLLLMHGQADRITSEPASARFAAAAPANLVTYRPWPNGRHELHNETFKAQVLTALTHWLAART
ncbi:MAG: lysophospholipase [Bernardetiaceae bacterium]|jgi:alpha-beta hydrolase superfamily lysophospholipase|nr:lysophospholipase [Bernardetiaceae bacterium]